MALSDKEVERYARHIVLPGVGGPGQKKLKDGRVLVIGAGGLGAPVLQYLAAAGLGTLGVVDDDAVSLSNLQRQVIHRTDDVGRPKAQSAADAIHGINPHVTVIAYSERLNRENALRLVGDYDLVLDGSDNFETRYVANDACYFAQKPLITGAVGQYDGFLTLFRSFEADANKQPKPSYRCLFPHPPAPGQALACEEAGVIGALTGVIGSMMALEAIKAIAGFGESLLEKLMIYDGRDGRTQTINYQWDPNNPLNGETPSITPETLGAIIETETA